MGSPHDTADYVRIAGSNGKGSTAVMVERILREVGLDAGLDTSPDLNDTREQVRLDGRKVPKEYLVSFVGRNGTTSPNAPPPAPRRLVSRY